MIAAITGLTGDALEEQGSPLAQPMAVRVSGEPIDLDPAAVAAAFPHATPRVVVFLHGLMETEFSWGARHTYGTRLQRELGYTPVYVRYNSGLHISQNGRCLSELMDELVAAWPVEIERVALVGHSMGGLVARSALHRAGGGTPGAHGWTHLVRDSVTLGTPHLGAPLERGVHRLAGVLARLPETRGLATLLALRSVGIKDLRRGTLVEEDWSGRDLDAPGAADHTHVPLHDGARHFVVLATLTRDPGGPLADLFGDLLVPPRSASGDTGGDDRLAFLPDHVHRLGGMNHLDLLNHPRVYEQIRAWLVTRPEGPRPAAPDEESVTQP